MPWPQANPARIRLLRDKSCIMLPASQEATTRNGMKLAVPVLRITLVFSIRHIVSEYHDKNGNLYMTIAHVDRIPVDQIGNIDPNREAQWGQYEDGPIDQGQ